MRGVTVAPARYTMTVCELIQRDHDEIAGLFDRLIELAASGTYVDECVHIAARLVATVRVHTLAEERVVYMALRSLPPELKAFALSAPSEHDNLETTLDKLLSHRPGDADYRMIIEVARDLFVMHARDEEEAEVLPAMVATLSPRELDSLAAGMRAEQARIRPQILRLLGIPGRAA